MAANGRLTIAVHALTWLADDITLLDVYDAVESAVPFGLHRTEPNPDCPVGRGIRPVLGDVYDGVQHVLRGELARTKVADVLRRTLAVPR